MKVQQELMRHASNPDDKKRLWTGNVIIQARSEWEGCGDGAQADEASA